jgi:hypothetical protein
MCGYIEIHVRNININGFLVAATKAFRNDTAFFHNNTKAFRGKVEKWKGRKSHSHIPTFLPSHKNQKYQFVAE